jgi:hypothetical protein
MQEIHAWNVIGLNVRKDTCRNILSKGPRLFSGTVPFSNQSDQLGVAETLSSKNGSEVVACPINLSNDLLLSVFQQRSRTPWIDFVHRVPNTVTDPFWPLLPITVGACRWLFLTSRFGLGYDVIPKEVLVNVQKKQEGSQHPKRFACQ